MSGEHRYVLGKCDYNGSGRRNCEAAITWSLKDGVFSMQGEIWNPAKSDLYEGGQCVDTVAKRFPRDKKAQRMVAIWQRWHLNDMRAGSPAQQAELKKHTFPGYPANHYEWASDVLTKAGLNPDNGYKYGHAWLREELPADVVAEIQSWSATP